MNNLVSAYKQHSRETYKSVARGVVKLNAACSTSITQTNLDQMEKGTRRIPESVSRYILKQVLPKEIKNYKSVSKLCERLSPPLRVKL